MIHRAKTFVIAVIAVLVLAAPRSAVAALCHFDAHFDGSGVPLKWLASPIKYHINASRLPAADQAAAIAAVQAAFKSWELPCTTLQFQYAGPSTAFGEVPGTINVYWGNDATSWPHGSSSYYWYYGGITSLATGEMTKASLGGNAIDWGWTVGGGPKAYDIQTALTWMIPGAIGFFVGNDPDQGSIGFQPNEVKRTLTAEHVAAARATYFKADPGCAPPIKLTPCELWDPSVDAGPVPDIGVADGGADGPTPDAAPPADAGPAADAPPVADIGPIPDVGTTVDGDDGAADQGPPPGDAPATTGGAGDDGCCSISHVLRADQGILLLLGLLALLRRRRLPTGSRGGAQ